MSDLYWEKYYPRFRKLAYGSVLLLILCWKPWDTSWQAIWIERWSLVAAIFVSYDTLFKSIAQGRNPIYGVVFSYIFCVTLYKATQALTPGNFEMEAFLRMGMLSSLGVSFALALSFSMELRVVESIWAIKLMGRVAAWGILYAWVRNHFHTPLVVPFLNNPSMTATLVALCLAPFFSLLGGVAILVSHSWTALFVWSVISVGKVGDLGCKRVDWVIFAGFLLVGSVGLYAHGVPDNGRFEMWRLYGEWFRQAPWQIQMFGTGLGTTQTFLPFVEMIHTGQANPTHFLAPQWLHNDWLEMFVELGAVGFSLVLLLVARVFVDLSPSWRFWAAGFCVAMVTNFPLHWAPLALVGWFILACAACRVRVDLSV